MTYFLYHYFDKALGPFQNLSSLSEAAALQVSSHIKQAGKTFASRRSDDYLTIRRDLEITAHNQFIAKGGNPQQPYPHYMTLGSCEWLESWYENPGRLLIDWEEFSEDSVSFTYGDLFPTMRYQDNKPYRRQVYTKAEIVEIIRRHGFPQEWNSMGDKGPERYIEVQVWDEKVIGKYLHKLP